jgi:hypothetical protein
MPDYPIYQKTVFVVDDRDVSEYRGVDIQPALITNWQMDRVPHVETNVLVINDIKEYVRDYEFVRITNGDDSDSYVRRDYLYVVNPEKLPLRSRIKARGWVVCPWCQSSISTGRYATSRLFAPPTVWVDDESVYCTGCNKVSALVACGDPLGGHPNLQIWPKPDLPFLK